MPNKQTPKTSTGQLSLLNSDDYRQSKSEEFYRLSKIPILKMTDKQRKRHSDLYWYLEEDDRTRQIEPEPDRLKLAVLVLVDHMQRQYIPIDRPVYLGDSTYLLPASSGCDMYQVQWVPEKGWITEDEAIADVVETCPTVKDAALQAIDLLKTLGFGISEPVSDGDGVKDYWWSKPELPSEMGLKRKELEQKQKDRAAWASKKQR